MVGWDGRTSPAIVPLPFLACSFALGMLLWCLFAGRTHPWADAAGRLPGIAALTLRVTRGDRPDLAALPADAPPGLRALIERCWAGDPSARPTAAAVALETAGWLRVRREMGRGKGTAVPESPSRRRAGCGCAGKTGCGF